jgi:ATP-binding cassette subfamily B protein/subfamily B ATP-binding cassette protein MsbA
VRFEGVSFGYEPGRAAVLRGVTLEALPGQTVAIVGPTGAGKTTLAGLAARFFDPWQGRVTLDGRDLRDVTLASLRRQVALVLQEPFLFPASVAENVAYGRPEATRAQVEAAARAANAEEFVSRLPEGYDTVVGERGATLSGGQRQRLSIARALLTDAPVLILDEPTSALDAGTESLILQAMERLTQDRTTFIIAHRFSTVRRADKIVVLDRGQVVECGTHEQLLAAGQLYARLYELQVGSRSDPDVIPTSAPPQQRGDVLV